MQRLETPIKEILAGRGWIGTGGGGAEYFFPTGDKPHLHLKVFNGSQVVIGVSALKPDPKSVIYLGLTYKDSKQNINIVDKSVNNPGVTDNEITTRIKETGWTSQQKKDAAAFINGVVAGRKVSGT